MAAKERFSRKVKTAESGLYETVIQAVAKSGKANKFKSLAKQVDRMLDRERINDESEVIVDGANNQHSKITSKCSKN